MSSSILLYENVVKLPHEVRWLDCSASPPKPVEGVDVTHTEQNFIQDMCCVQKGNEQLLITTKGFGGGVYAYNTSTDKLVWYVEGKLPGIDNNIRPLGVTTDGRGHLFVCDNDNKCTHMFSTDGGYMGSLLKEEKNPQVQVAGICWSDRFSSLITVHTEEGKCRMSSIQNTQENTETLFKGQTEEVMTPLETLTQVEEATQEKTFLVQTQEQIEEYETAETDASQIQTEEPIAEVIIIEDETPALTKEEMTTTHQMKQSSISLRTYTGKLHYMYLL